MSEELQAQFSVLETCDKVDIYHGISVAGWVQEEDGSYREITIGVYILEFHLHLIESEEWVLTEVVEPTFTTSGYARYERLPSLLVGEG